MMSASMLQHKVTLHEDECQVSFAARLAKSNGYRDLGEFGWMTRINPTKLVSLNLEDAKLLSQWSGVPVARLQRFAIAGNNVTRFGSTSIRRSQLEKAALRICRHCLCRDLDTECGHSAIRPYVRASWRWRVVGSCPVHGCELEPIKSDDVTAWVTHRIDTLKSNLPEIRHPNPADVYFAGRVSGSVQTIGFLDHLPGYVAAEFCTVMGYFKNPPENSRERNRVPDGFMNASCRNEGYKIASQGKDAVLSFLSQHVNAANETAIAFKDVYGVVYRWLKKLVNDPDYQTVVKLFQRHAEQHIPMAKGDIFLTEVKKREVHTVRSAAEEYKITQERVEGVLEKYGFTSGLQNGRPKPVRVFSRAALHEQLTQEACLLTTPMAANRLGCSSRFVDMLLQKGHLSYHSNSKDFSRVFRRIAIEDVESLIARITAMRSPASNAGLVSIESATFTCHCRTDEIVDLIFSGKLTKVSWSGDELHLRNLLVDPQEIIQNLSKTEDDDYLGVSDLEKHLRTTSATVYELFKRGIIPVHLRPHPRTRIKQRVVHTLALQEFTATYISLSALARDRRKQIAVLKAILDEKGIKPIFEPTRGIARFYRKSDLGSLDLA